MIYLVLILLITAQAINKVDDKVAAWPSWPGKAEEYGFDVYSGYIPLTNTTRGQLHYVFLTTQNTNTENNDPLILWLNGGPGCSSLLGLLQEIGPFVVDNGKTEFVRNDFAWNRKANLLFLESPGGVGFSKAPNAPFTYTDVQVGEDNYDAIVQFLDVFTEYQTRDFYISGESYAGIYIPQTANQVVLNAAKRATASLYPIKLVGVLIGNGVLSNDDKFRSEVADNYLVRRNFYDLTTQTGLLHQCTRYPQSPTCKYAQRAQSLATDEINPYNIYGYCWGDSTLEQFKQPKSTRFPYTPWIKRESKKQQGQQGLQSRDPDAPCIDFGPLQNHLNIKEVQDALHIDETANPEFTWTGCSKFVGDNYQKNVDGSWAILPELHKNGIKILLYSGDQDLAVSVHETQRSLSKYLKLKAANWSSYINEIDGSQNLNQLEGWYSEYDYITLYIVRAAGHMVPQDQREAAYNMLDKFIKPLVETK